MINNTQRAAVVTGASSGIGKETAKALAALGWRVIAIGRNAERRAAAMDTSVTMPRANPMRAIYRSMLAGS